MRSLVLMLSALLVGCSGESSDKDGSPGDDDDDDDTVVETAHTGGGGTESGMNPVAVGFELVATLEADGSLGGYDYGDGGGLNAPRVIMTFADEDYFSPNVTDQTGHFCVVVGFMADPYSTNPIAPLVKPDQLETRSFGLKEGTPYAPGDSALVFESYDMSIVAIAETVDTPCAGLVDAEIWGEEAENLLTPFLGAHFGWGFGRMTPYLQEYFLAEDETTNEFVAEYGDAMMAGYVAINNIDGEFMAYDWTTSILFQNDPDTNLVSTDPKDDTLLPLPVVDVPVGGELPEGYIQSYAYWYQDFVRMDLTNLTDGAPVYP